LPKEEEAQQAFRRKWLHSYVISPRGLHLVASEDNEVVGYLICETDTLKNNELMEMHESLRLFASLFKEFPAHFHINVHPKHHGKGIGNRLVNHLISELSDRGINKVCVITNLYADNVDFYRKVGFKVIESQKIGDTELVFLGRETH